VIALDLDVIFHAGESGDFLPTAHEALGLRETIASRIDLFGLFLDVLEQALQKTARVGHFRLPFR